ncbi:PREDICTED: uncharacterized protein LOC104709578 [Camelina sativa]|uniref:Uncharacterized protein LOC104709578 n=1 Tax=Camelina sativa TaxID=90675 RepID=A0ABM0TD04_CAMSA|nr:PREDICTED: uncharacterized protein LOC104709578 [Camelina sativa]
MVVESADQFIHARISSDSEVINVIVVYAAPSASRRSGLWAKLSGIISSLEEPVLIGGDFNTIVRVDEKSGGNGRLSSDSLEFGNWINSLSLIDLGFCGNQFTWKRGRTEVVTRDPRRRPFRFEAAWLKHPSFKELLGASWDDRHKTTEALAALQNTLKRWNRDVFGDIQKTKETLIGEIKTFQDTLDLYHTDELIQKEEDLLKSFDIVLE